MKCTIVSNRKELDLKCKNEKEEPYIQIKKDLLDKIWSLFTKGYDEFYVNCEYGIPLWAAEAICSLKKYNEIYLYIVAPFEEQTTDWQEALRDRYFSMHRQADEVEFAEPHRTEDSYDIADEKMIDDSDLLLVYGSEKDGLYAAKYAKKIGRKTEFESLHCFTQ